VVLNCYLVKGEQIMRFNDLDLDSWKELDLNVDSLWLIGERDKSGKHSNLYHGNFIPQIPNQLIRRFTKSNDTVLDPFLGSGTTLFECEKLNRKLIGFDINRKMNDYVRSRMINYDKHLFDIQECDVTNKTEFEEKISLSLKKLGCTKTQFVIIHPPYLDIIKFTDEQSDLSHIKDVDTFIDVLDRAISNALLYLERTHYFAVIIGDVYKNSEVIPLAFHVLYNIKSHYRVKLKGIIIKNIEGNRGKLGMNGIWKYRAIKSDYYIFKHEYILVFKKEY